MTLQIFDLVSGTMPCVEAVEQSETDEVAPAKFRSGKRAVSEQTEDLPGYAGKVLSARFGKINGERS